MVTQGEQRLAACAVDAIGWLWALDNSAVQCRSHTIAGEHNARNATHPVTPSHPALRLEDILPLLAVGRRAALRCEVHRSARLASRFAAIRSFASHARLAQRLAWRGMHASAGC